MLYRTEKISERVVFAVAQAVDADVTDLEPLHDVIETDALNALYGDASSSRSNPVIKFSYAGCDVTINANSDVDVEVRDRAVTGSTA